jgi:hypothetical protein
VCGDGLKLFEGICQDSCPDGYEVLGSGDFGQECAVFLSCRVSRDFCNTCDAENQHCLRCYGARKLLDGQCVNECPEGYDEVGSGYFGRKCELAPPCTVGRDNCNTCSIGQTECTLCYNAKRLLNGTCVDECPEGYDDIGSGNFGRECVVAPPCVEGRENCHTCSGDAQECLLCYDAKLLLNGTCVDECPEGFGEIGSGRFGRECTFPPCVEGEADCNTCSIDRLQCEICYNGKKLVDGECIDVCPQGFEEVGRGNFGRTCREVRPWEVGRDNCNTCSADNLQCEICYNAKRLFNGTCVDACPPGFSETGSGNFGRECTDSTGCNHPECYTVSPLSLQCCHSLCPPLYA